MLGLDSTRGSELAARSSVARGLKGALTRLDVVSAGFGRFASLVALFCGGSDWRLVLALASPIIRGMFPGGNGGTYRNGKDGSGVSAELETSNGKAGAGVGVEVRAGSKGEFVDFGG